MKSKSLALPLLFAFGLACGGNAQKLGPADPGQPKGSLIVKEVSGAVETAEDAPEGMGRLVLDIYHTDRAVNQKVKVLIGPDGSQGRGEGLQAFDLPPGEYQATLVYSASEQASDFKGKLSGLKVNLGRESRYRVMLDAPVGMLRAVFTYKGVGMAEPENINEKVAVEVYKGGEEADLTTPVWSGPAGEWAYLPTGTYDMKAEVSLPEQPRLVEWYRELAVGRALARTEQVEAIQDDGSGVRIDAFNFGVGINDYTTIAFFRPGADVEVAKAIKSARAGEKVQVEPGTYDIWVVYVPPNSPPDIRPSTILRDVEIEQFKAFRRQVDVKEPLGTIRLKVMTGDEDVSDAAELRVFRKGADLEAATPVLDEVGVDEHPVPAGVFDITISAPGLEVPRVFEGQEIPNGGIWEQSFDTKEPSWQPAPTKRPAGPMRPIDYVEPKKAADDDDSAGDDDDSAGDHDDSSAGSKAAGEAKPEPTASPAPGADGESPTEPKGDGG